MLTGLYLVAGVVVMLYASRPFWSRVSGVSKQRLWMLCVVILLAWPGVGLLALCDRKRTIHEYIEQWLFSEDIKS